MDKLQQNQIVRRLQFELDGFSQVSQEKFNFRCPICGDSQKSRSKKRGWLGIYKENYTFRCFNCNASMGLKNFLKTIDSPLIEEYYLGSFKKDTKREEKKVEIDSSFFQRKLPSKYLLSNFKEHYSIDYIRERKIPEYSLKLLGHTDFFKKTVNFLLPNSFSNCEYDEPRLIIPFYSKEGKLIAIQGRSYNKNSKLRYITIKLDKNATKIFGLERVDFRKTFYITEGPIDSLFLPNALAMAGSSLDFSIFKDHSTNGVVIYDNEPRNLQIVNSIRNAINTKLSCVIWPNNIKGKDINDMILAGTTESDLLKIINDNTFSGLKALMRFNDWKRT
jgi:hypothetical protein